MKLHLAAIALLIPLVTLGSPVVPFPSPIPPRAFAYSGSFPAGAGELESALTVSNTRRSVFLYAPENRGPQPPLLIAFHGSGSATDVGLGKDIVGRFEPMADAHGIVVAGPDPGVQPQGDWDQHTGGERYWETMPRKDPAHGRDPNRNPDLLLVRAIIQEARRAYHIDPKRVYLAGYSNGAFFALHAAIVLRDQVGAFLALDGGLVRCENTNSCQFYQGKGTTCAQLRAERGYCACIWQEKPIALPLSGRMPPGYISHGNRDDVVSVSYSCELAQRMRKLGHTATVEIRNGGGHDIPDYGDPKIYGPLWAFFQAHPLPAPSNSLGRRDQASPSGL